MAPCVYFSPLFFVGGPTTAQIISTLAQHAFGVLPPRPHTLLSSTTHAFTMSEDPSPPKKHKIDDDHTRMRMPMPMPTSLFGMDADDLPPMLQGILDSLQTVSSMGAVNSEKICCEKAVCGLLSIFDADAAVKIISEDRDSFPTRTLAVCLPDIEQKEHWQEIVKKALKHRCPYISVSPPSSPANE